MKRSKIVLAITVLMALALLLADRFQTNRKINALLTAQNQAGQQNGDFHSPDATSAGELNETVRQLEQTRAALAETARQLTNLNAKVANLEKKIENLRSERSLVDSSATASSDTSTTPRRRAWGPEQVVGPPDTQQAGDIPTAWASRQPDAGEEWLRLDYERSVHLSEVRVRETYNSGAISKVSAFLPGGQEVVIWEGQEPPGEAPVETVFKVAGNVWAQSVKVYLDTSRVPGWNEIDAVELVGKDGTRQWASQASASSTYADLSSPLLDGARGIASQRELLLR